MIDGKMYEVLSKKLHSENGFEYKETFVEDSALHVVVSAESKEERWEWCN
jgi:hypothetical protein